MAYLVLDLETIPDPELPPPKPRPDRPDPFPPPPCHQIVEIGCAWIDDDESKPIALATLSREGDERVMLAKLGAILQRAPTVVTWNGRHFDMPVVTVRSMRHGLSTTARG
ncbi:MAG TPA: ribonuclease H-like domain-containing protein [Polyangiaceae bacterium]|nr:ribonuclease H-like domain-containing protein [Polyangiaceae bacterium]